MLPVKIRWSQREASSLVLARQAHASLSCDTPKSHPVFYSAAARRTDNNSASRRFNRAHKRADKFAVDHRRHLLGIEPSTHQTIACFVALVHTRSLNFDGIKSGIEHS